jgi:hypothetical protein
VIGLTRSGEVPSEQLKFALRFFGILPKAPALLWVLAALTEDGGQDE